MMAVTLAAQVGASGAEPVGEGSAPFARELTLPREHPAREPSLPGEYQLRRSGEGFSYSTAAFVADIAPDGVVTFHDRKLFLSRPGFISDPLPLPPGTMSLQDWLFGRPHKRWLKPAPPPVPSPAVGFDLAPVLCPTTPFDPACIVLTYEPLIGGLAVAGDANDAIIRSLGQDPYAVEKAKFLAATFELRMKLAAQAHREEVETSLDGLPATLAKLWHDTRYSARERRRILFELWREAAPTPAGARARAIIESFIRRELPCGGPDAYPPAELRALQSSESGTPGETFAPYGACAG